MIDGYYLLGRQLARVLTKFCMAKLKTTRVRKGRAAGGKAYQPTKIPFSKSTCRRPIRKAVYH